MFGNVTDNDTENGTKKLIHKKRRGIHYEKETD